MVDTKNLVAEASTHIDAPVVEVWDALVNPEKIKHYFFGTTVKTSWREGSPITWSGEWQGKSYVDRGIILKVERGQLLQYTHYSPLSGLPDEPENYHTVTIELASEGDQTGVLLSQDNNASVEERIHSAQNWNLMLDALKKFVES